MSIHHSLRSLWLLLAVAFLMADSLGHASSEPIRFVYVHGTNQNTKESHQRFNQKVSRLHPYIKDALEQEPLAQEHLLDGGRQMISPQPISFFWGDLSQEELTTLHRSLFSSQLTEKGLNLAERARK